MAIGNGIVFLLFLLLIPVIGVSFSAYRLSVTAASLETVGLIKEEDVLTEHNKSQSDGCTVLMVSKLIQFMKAMHGKYATLCVANDRSFKTLIFH